LGLLGRPVRRISRRSFCPACIRQRSNRGRKQLMALGQQELFVLIQIRYVHVNFPYPRGAHHRYRLTWVNLPSRVPVRTGLQPWLRGHTDQDETKRLITPSRTPPLAWRQGFNRPVPPGPVNPRPRERATGFVTLRSPHLPTPRSSVWRYLEGVHVRRSTHQGILPFQDLPQELFVLFVNPDDLRKEVHRSRIIAFVGNFGCLSHLVDHQQYVRISFFNHLAH
jgi:hypothetical protein